MAGKNRKKQQVYAFIDTNIFLDFYRSKNETSLSLLKKLETVSDNIICTYQVEMEFLKNRQSEIIKNSVIPSLVIDADLPAVMEDTQISSYLKKEKSTLSKKRKDIEKRIINIITKPSLYDPVYKSLETIFNNPNSHVLTRDMKERHEIKKRAWRRFMLGYPPRKSDDTSISDALNWEWLIDCCKELKGKFLIVSRDSDFGVTFNKESFLNDALKKEFRQRVGNKSIKLTNKLSEALKDLEVKVTRKEEESEAKQIRSLNANIEPSILAKDPAFASFWTDYLRDSSIWDSKIEEVSATWKAIIESYGKK